MVFDDVDPVELDDEDRPLAHKLFGAVERIPPEARHVVAMLKGGNRRGKARDSRRDKRVLARSARRLAQGDRVT